MTSRAGSSRPWCSATPSTPTEGSAPAGQGLVRWMMAGSSGLILVVALAAAWWGTGHSDDAVSDLGSLDVELDDAVGRLEQASAQADSLVRDAALWRLWIEVDEPAGS